MHILPRVLVVLCLGVCTAFPGTQRDYNTIERYISTSSATNAKSSSGSNSDADNAEETLINTNSHSSHHGHGAGGNHRNSDETRALKKVFLSNRSVTCNDGSQAGFYLRKSHSSKKWIIFLEGGWYCYDQHTCKNRWLHQRHYMTSSQWPETRDVGGILSPNENENPFWYNVNHVYVPYCSSDSWSGSRGPTANEMFSFMGATIVQQVVRDLVPLGLENSTDLLLTGSSAGGTGAMLNLDSVQELLHDMLGLKHIAVRGVCDSGWFLDRAPYIPTGEPVVDAVKNGMQLWQGKVPKNCRLKYVNEPWKCYYGYRLYPMLRNPLFVFQWLFDEAQMDADNVGAPVSKQQWDYIHKMGEALRQSFENVSAVFAPSCISHSVLTKRDWIHVKVNEVSVAQAIHCWERSSLAGFKKGLRRKNRRKNKNNSNRNGSNNNNNNNNENSNNMLLGDEPRKKVRKLGRNNRNNLHNKNGENRERKRDNNKNGNGKNRRKGLETNSKENLERRIVNDTNNNSNSNNNQEGGTVENAESRRRRKKHRNKNRNKNRNGKRQNRNRTNQNSTVSATPNVSLQDLEDDKQRSERSLLKTQQQQKHNQNCHHQHHQHHHQRPSKGHQCQNNRYLENCSWPQCNNSCPKLHNPFTGEEMDLLELLQSFGVDMESVAKALGIDLNTLNNMDHSELLNLLTQGKVKDT